MGASADIVIRQVAIIDGTGAAAKTGDIAIDKGRIIDIAPVVALTGKREIDGKGLSAAPGFIDVHTHDDRAVLATDMACKLSQGVTTVVTGNCGISLGPLPNLPPLVSPLDLIAEGPGDLFRRFGDYLSAVQDSSPAVNSVALVGHSTLRMATMDRLDRPASASECRHMRDLLHDALSDGAIGLSTGLYYEPANAASTAEIIAISQPLAAFAGIYATHLRDEADLILDAMDEAFTIGRAANAPVVLSHHKVTNPNNFGRTRETLPVIERQSREQPLSLDVYPYAASSTVLEAKRALIVERILITWSKARPDLAGRMLSDIARDMHCDRTEAVARLQPAGAIYFAMNEDDVQRVLQFPLTMVGSDGLPHDASPHPRLWGTFPRVLGHYVRDVGLFGLAEAVRRMTSMPAARFGLANRGTLRVDAHADLVLFDAARVIDTADFTHPARTADGIELVLVNGVPAYEQGGVTGARAGRMLRNAELAPKEFNLAAG